METENLAINGGEPIRKELLLIHKPFLTEKDFLAVYETIKTTYVSGDGPDCKKFEKMLSEYLGVKHVFFLNSCTTALDLAYKIKNFPAGSEVIIPNFTYTSTALGPLLNNLKVVLADVEPETGNIDTTKIEDLITDKTVAISPVDYAGRPANMDHLNEIALKYNLYVVHDAAQSIGAKYKGKLTGTLADVSTFSFHGTKNITTGEGGVIVTNNDELAEKIKIMREKGTDKHSFLSDNNKKGYYEYVSIGNSYVQSNILGALGVNQLMQIDYITKRRKEISSYYFSKLNQLKNIKLPSTNPDYEPNWHIFYILVPKKYKYWMIDAFKAEGIMTNVHYTPLHMNRYYKSLGTDHQFPGSIKFFEGLIRLPIYPSLTDEEIDDVTRATIKISKTIS